MKGRAFEIADIKDEVNSNNLIYSFRTKGNKPKDFWKLSNATEIIWRFKDGNVNPKEVLKNQSRFTLDLNEIKIWGNKSVDQKNTIKNITAFSDLLERVINFFKDYSLLLSEAKYKTKYRGRLKY